MKLKSFLLAAFRTLWTTNSPVFVWIQSILLLAIRLYWGWGFFRTGRGKFLHFHDIVDYFRDLKIPAPEINAAMATTTECVGGILLIAGLASRLTSIPLIVTMVVAYITTEQEALHAITSDPDKFTKADPFLFLLASLVIFAFGPGKLSLDTLLERKIAASATTKPQMSRWH